MSIDLYALCPCGSGKKIKFCCRDLAEEIEKIQRMLNAGQRQACLEHIELLEKKYPNRAYLIATKAELQRQLGHEGDAGDTLQSLLELDQENPIVLAESVLLALSNEDEGVETAIERLQRTVEASPRDPWPEKVKEAIAAVAEECFRTGLLTACLAHMVLFLEADPENEGAGSALVRFAESEFVPLLFKEIGAFQKCADDVAWKEEFNAAMVLADRGSWLAGEQKLTSLADQAGGDPAFWHNLAILRMWLGREEDAAKALRKYAESDLPLEDALEATALALQLDPTQCSETHDVLRVTYPITDMERVISTLSSDRRLIELGSQEDLFEDEPPPRSTHLVLDRANLEDGADLALDKIPIAVGRLFVYGKETDREARIEYHLIGDASSLANKGRIAEIFDQALGLDQVEEEVIDESLFIPFSDHEELWFPRGAQPDDVRALRVEKRRRFLFDAWPKRPWKYLDGKTPEETAKQPEGQIKLLGFLLYAELGSQKNNVSDFDFNELRRHLTLPESASIDPTGLELPGVPLWRLARLEMERLSDDDLLTVFARAVHHRASAAAQKAALELVTRPTLDKRVGKAGIYRTLAFLTDDSQQALEYVDQARRLAEEAGESSAIFDLQELSLRVRRGEGELVSQLLDHVIHDHLEEPGVRQEVRNILVSLGMLNPDGSIPQSTAPNAAAAAAGDSSAAESSPIWTPDSEPSDPGDKPKILLPD